MAALLVFSGSSMADHHKTPSVAAPNLNNNGQLLAPVDSEPAALKTKIQALFSAGDFDDVLEQRIVVVSRKIAQRRAKAELLSQNDQKKKQLVAINEHIPFGKYEGEHVRGIPGAKITIVEYGDFGCPYCGKFHNSAKQVITEDENVNWVYRHFPIRGPESSSSKLAYASECIQQQGGVDAFWKFTDQIFKNKTALQNPEQFIGLFAKVNELDHAAIKDCQQSDETINKVKESGRIAQKGKFTGTPGIVVRNNVTGDMKLVLGAVDASFLKKVIDELSVPSKKVNPTPLASK